HAAKSHVGLDHAHHFEFAEDILDAIGWVGPDGSQAYEADLCAAITHVPNRVTRRHRMAALYEKDDVGSFGHEFFDPWVVPSSEDFRELVVDLFNDRHRTFHGARTLQLK